MDTEILVLDEPTANLDTEGIIKLQDQIRKLKETGHTVIIAEHRLYFLEGLIDRAVFIKNGEIIKIYSGRDFFALSDDERIEMGFAHIETRAFISSVCRKKRLPEKDWKLKIWLVGISTILI